MFGFLSLHSIAAARGDGLRPELLEMIAEQRALTAGDANISDLEQRRASGTIQAGANPAGCWRDGVAENVVAFQRPARPQSRERDRSLSKLG